MPGQRIQPTSALPRPARAARLLAVAVAACAALFLLGHVERASAYSKPAGGKWKFENLFEYTKRGALRLSRDGSKVTHLVLVPGADQVEACGKKPIKLATKPRIVRFRRFSGRYAIGNVKHGLLVGKPLPFRQGHKRFRARLQLVWGETGRLVDLGRFERGGCHLSFYARKGG